MFKSKALMLRVCAGTAVTLLTLFVQPLEARHSLVPRDGFVKNCVRFLGEHWQDKSKLVCEDNDNGYLCPKDQCTSGDYPSTHATLFSTMSWTGCKRLLGNGRGEAEGVTAVQPITVQFLEGQQIAVRGHQNGVTGVFDFECKWNSPSDPNARTPYCGGCHNF